MEMSGLWVADQRMKELLKSATGMHGALCVIIDGAQMMPMSFADSFTTDHMVCIHLTSSVTKNGPSLETVNYTLMLRLVAHNEISVELLLFLLNHKKNTYFFFQEYISS